METFDWANLGIAGALAAILFFVFQTQSQRYSKILDLQDEKFSRILERQDRLIDELLAVVRSNTEALTGVKVAIEEFRRFLDKLEARVADLERQTKYRRKDEDA